MSPATSMPAKKRRRGEAFATGIADGIKGCANVGIFALTYAVLHDWAHIDRAWALVAAAVYALSETRGKW